MAKQHRVLSLNRILTLPIMTLYGVGTMIGAGIYALIGEVIGVSGTFTPYAFILSAIVALFTSLSYGELSALLPKCAGEAAYAHEGFKSPKIATLIGWLTITTGVVSSSSILSSFVSYFQLIFHYDLILTKTIVVFLITLLAARGVNFSVRIACFITLIEIGGLLFILYLGGFDSILYYKDNLSQLLPPTSFAEIKSVVVGSFLAFYAFIGFEDMVNMAEEVQSPKKTLHRAILLAMLIASVLYILVSFVAVSAVAAESLTESETPLVSLVAMKGERAKLAVTLVGVTSLINGGLVQILMASRVIYGMSRQKIAPRIFSYVHPRTKNPIVATATVGVITWILILIIEHLFLAKITTFVILIIFSVVNTSLILIKTRNHLKDDRFKVPLFVPYLGLFLNLLLIGVEISHWMGY